MHVCEAFEFIQLFDISYAHSVPGTPLGRVHYEYDTDRHYGLWRLFTSLAGPAADKQMHPSLSWGAIALNGASHDFEQAWEITKRELGAMGGRFVDDIVRTTMRQFVRNEWDRIVKLRERPDVCSNRTLSYEECLIVLGRGPNVALAETAA